VYDNRYVLWGHMRWGLVTDYEVYEDTQEAKRFDEHLAAGTDAEGITSMPRHLPRRNVERLKTLVTAIMRSSARPIFPSNPRDGKEGSIGVGSRSRDV
jgi:hypothetical protein